MEGAISSSSKFLGSLAAWHHPAEKAKARLLIVHGLSEHSGRHLNTVDFFTKHNVECVRFDLRGAGQSGGRRQWIESFDHYVVDTTHVFNWVSRDFPPLPLFVLGHSLGGAIATYFTATHQNSMKGLILSAPATEIGKAIPPMKVMAARMIAKILPTMRFKTLGGMSLSKDPEVQRAYQNDPLSYHYTRAHQGAEILGAMEKISEQAAKIRLPVLITHGTSDRIIGIEGSFSMLNKLASHDKSLQILPNVYHEAHNDLEKEEYFQTVLRWIMKRL